MSVFSRRFHSKYFVQKKLKQRVNMWFLDQFNLTVTVSGQGKSAQITFIQQIYCNIIDITEFHGDKCVLRDIVMR